MKNNGKKVKHTAMAKQNTFIDNFVRDIKINGIAYVKSTVVANQIKALDPDIQFVWNKEDRSYTAYYNKDYKEE